MTNLDHQLNPLQHPSPGPQLCPQQRSKSPQLDPADIPTSPPAPMATINIPAGSDSHLQHPQRPRRPHRTRQHNLSPRLGPVSPERPRHPQWPRCTWQRGQIPRIAVPIRPRQTPLAPPTYPLAPKATLASTLTPTATVKIHASPDYPVALVVRQLLS